MKWLSSAGSKARKEPSLLPRIGIDEEALAKGQNVVSLIYDLDHSTVEANAMDMSPADVKTTTQCIPLAEEKIVHDPFHVMKLANEALDKVRKQEHKRLLEQDGDGRAEYVVGNEGCSGDGCADLKKFTSVGHVNLA